MLRKVKKRAVAIICISSIMALNCSMLSQGEELSALEVYNKIISAQGSESILTAGVTSELSDVVSSVVSTGVSVVTSTSSQTNTGSAVITSGSSSGPGVSGSSSSVGADGIFHAEAVPDFPPFLYPMYEEETEPETEPETEAPPEPSVVSITLSQSYNSDFDLYEYSARDYFYIYSNVGNGGITDQSVYVDIPSNVVFQLEKDGINTSYKRKSDITEPGSYVFRFTTGLIEEDDAIYNTTLRFRIEPAREIEVEEIEVEEVESEILIEETIAEEIEIEETEAEQDPVEEVVVLPVQTSDASTSLVSEFDATTSYFKNTLSNGSYFYTNIPNGFLTNNSVKIQSTDETLTFEVYKDGELQEYVPGEQLTEHGAYSVFAADAIFSFRIVTKAINDIGVFAAPANHVIEKVFLDGVELESLATGATSLYLEEDGQYAITISGKVGELTSTFVKDTTAPRVDIDVDTDNIATITYLSSDAVDCQLLRGNELLSTGRLIGEIEGEGEYTLTVLDEAGNSNQYTFKITYGFNSAAVIAIVLVILLAAALVWYIRKMKKNIGVR